METTLADDSKKNAANNQFRKLRQAEEGKRAMTEYENNAIASAPRPRGCAPCAWRATRRKRLLWPRRRLRR